MADFDDDIASIRPITKDAFRHVRESIEYIDGTSGINETDLIFLKGLMDSPIMKNLVKVSTQQQCYRQKWTASLYKVLNGKMIVTPDPVNEHFHSPRMPE
ncbi:hypothetical protein TcasGA2_TC033081 [Tribolium castaneum]|uniref:Uncharacterized protein n=2 Tax=Tribolium castaneum TaxID=7070 RepID=A0A139WI88_TRICA|nr:hypothetical protein TcasGA2_TC033081 [Tribolium castaneum]